MSDRKLLIFDMDGTILNSLSIYPAMIEAFARQNNLKCDLEKMVSGWSDPLKKDLGWGISLEDQPAMCKKQELFHCEQAEQGNFLPEVFPGLDKIIPELAEKYDLSLITVNLRSITKVFLEKNDLNRFFPVRRTLCCTRERGYQMKPSPDAFYCLINETGHDPAKTIMIGDSSHDIEMANAAGIKNIAVLWGITSSEKVLAVNPTIAIDRTADLPQAIEKVFSL
jgi:phosphoglycolate phosphatase